MQSTTIGTRVGMKNNVLIKETPLSLRSFTIAEMINVTIIITGRPTSIIYPVFIMDLINRGSLVNSVL